MLTYEDNVKPFKMFVMQKRCLLIAAPLCVDDIAVHS